MATTHLSPFFLLLLPSITILAVAGREARTINLREPENADMVQALAQGLVRRYNGNSSSASSSAPTSEHFRLLELDGDFLLIGAADSVHNLSIASFKPVNIFHWEPGPEERRDCEMKTMEEGLCRNFVRVLGRLSRDRLLVCGTNAFRPACRVVSAATWETLAELPGTGLVPMDPAQNSSHLLAHGDQLYSATVADFASTDALLFRRNVSDPEDRGLRTQRGNAFMLDRPQFVGTLQNEEFVYLFFREEAAEADFQPATFSRVARVCKRDRGGPGQYGLEWTSFVKARLNCSIPAAARGRPFYFDQLVALSSSASADGLVYATFVTEFDFLRHSVVCAFRLAQIDALFRSGPFLAFNTAQRRWTPRPRDDQTAGLGQCQAESERMGEDEALARRKFPLMADAVPNALGAAAGIHRGSDHYGQIAVLPGVRHDAGASDILYVATDQGNVLKLANLANNVVPVNGSNGAANGTSPTPPPPPLDDPLVPVATIQLCHAPIRRLLIATHRPAAAALIVVTDSTVYRLPLHFCGFHPTCADCVGSRDPHCVWHGGKCQGREEWEAEKRHQQGAEEQPVQDVFGRKEVDQLCEGLDGAVKKEAGGGGDERAAPSSSHLREAGDGRFESIKSAKTQRRMGANGKCECSNEKSTNGPEKPCECGDEAEQQLFLMEEPAKEGKKEGGGGKTAWTQRLQSWPWWIVPLALLALVQTLAAIACWALCSRWRHRGGKLGGGPHHAVTPSSFSKLSPFVSHHHHSCSSGLISAYSPASILSGGPAKEGQHGGDHHCWTTTLSSASNRTSSSSTASSSKGGGGGKYGQQKSGGGKFLLHGWMPRRAASLSGGEISVQLEGSAAPSAGMMTLPLAPHLPPAASFQYEQQQRSMSTFLMR